MKLKKIFKTMFKYIVLFISGGLSYITIESIFRGYSHWTMFLLGGSCFIMIGSINNLLSWETPLVVQAFIGGMIITTLEFITGCIVNIKLGWNIWDYSDLPLNIKGQVCVPFMLLWVLLSVIAILADDYLRYWWFKEDKPRYVIV